MTCVQIRDTDLDMLERVVGIVAFGDLDGEDTCNLTDLNFLRIFRLSQLTAEYLLHVQDHLAQENSQLKVFCTSYIAFRAHMPAHKAAQQCIAIPFKQAVGSSDQCISYPVQQVFCSQACLHVTASEAGMFAFKQAFGSPKPRRAVDT